jgi:DNA-binding MarR family transcriptional regulator
MLETLLARVLRLVSVHLEAPVSDLAGTALSAAEGSLLLELLAAGEVTQQQMADRLMIDKSRVSRLCTALERKHLVTRERDESNRRSLRVRVTGSGQEVAARLRQAWRAYHEHMLAAMSTHERRSLLVGLTAFARELTALHPIGQASDSPPDHSGVHGHPHPQPPARSR